MKIWKLILLIGCGGFLGTLARYALIRLTDRWSAVFPWGTLTVNLLGSFAAGFLFVLCRTKFAQYEVYFPVIFLGFLGAFTTFSTFALDSSKMLLAGNYFRFFSNILLQNVFGIAAAAGGLFLAQMIFRSARI